MKNKTEVYLNALQLYSELFVSRDPAGIKDFLLRDFNIGINIFLLGSNATIQKYKAWKKLSAEGDTTKTMLSFGDLILAMRADLGGKDSSAADLFAMLNVDVEA